MDQPSSLRTLFKLGGLSVSPSSHVVVHDASSHEAGLTLVRSLAQLSSHPLQCVSESVWLHSRSLHASSSNDGASCRVPLVVGRCEDLSKQLGWDVETRPPNQPDWIVRSHSFVNETFMPSFDGSNSSAGQVSKSTELALHFFSFESADATKARRNTQAAVLWFAKEILACDISKLAADSTGSTVSDSASSSAAPSDSLHRVLSPLPNAQLNIDRLKVSYAFPSSVASSASPLDLISFTNQLEFLITAENAEMEMQLPKPATTASAAATAGVTAASSSSSSSSSVLSPTSFTPSPSPPVSISVLDPHASPPVAKHTPLQPLPAGSGAKRRHGFPIIAVDLDEVLGEFVAPLSEWHNEQYGTAFTVVDYHSYHFAAVWGGSNEESQEKIAQFFKSKYFADIPVVPEALEVLQTLQKRFDLAVVTSRQHSIEAQTREWLAKHYPNVFCAIFFGNHYGLAGSGSVRSKPEMCLEINAVALIDDSLIYARQCASVVEKVCLFDWKGRYTWNRNTTEPLPINVVRCLSWEIIAEQFDNWQPSGERLRLNGEPE